MLQRAVAVCIMSSDRHFRLHRLEVGLGRNTYHNVKTIFVFAVGHDVKKVTRWTFEEQQQNGND